MSKSAVNGGPLREDGAPVDSPDWREGALGPQPAPCKVSTEVGIPICNGRYDATFFTFGGLVDGLEHVALALGPWRTSNKPMVRLHSECLTGDVFASQRCDCGSQLLESLERISAAGGVLIYLRQEGRGIGLYNKLASYVLQSAGMDTYQANAALGFPADLRNYTAAAQMLSALGISRIALLTNNPAKADQLRRNGIEVDEVLGTGVFMNPHNRAYLKAKSLSAGHRFHVGSTEDD